MSIWCSGEPVGFDPGEPTAPRGGQVRSYATGFSNHHPTCDGAVEQPASVEVAHLAPWCVPGHNQDGGAAECTSCGVDHEAVPGVGEWLRLSVDSVEHAFSDGGRPTGRTEHASVVLDEAAVRQLVADLTSWLDAPKVRPVPPPTLGGPSTPPGHS